MLWGWFLSLSRTAERMKASMDMMSKGINPRRQLDRLLAKANRLQVRGICVVRASVRVFVCMCMCARPWMRMLTRKPKRPNPPNGRKRPGGGAGGAGVAAGACPPPAAPPGLAAGALATCFLEDSRQAPPAATPAPWDSGLVPKGR